MMSLKDGRPVAFFGEKQIELTAVAHGALRLFHVDVGLCLIVFM